MQGRAITGRAVALTALAALAALALTGSAAASAATFHVHNTHDSGNGSLRKAIAGANANADPNDRIVVPAGTYRLSSGELLVDESMSIQGAGTRKTVIDARRNSRVLEVTAATHPLVLSDLTITGGRAQFGGGILNAGEMTLMQVAVRDNLAAGAGSGQANLGGGIENTGSLTILGSAISDNAISAKAEGFGAGIDLGDILGGTTGPVTIIRSSLTGNRAPTDGFGAAIATETSATVDAGLTIVDSTVSHNFVGGGPDYAGSGGAILYEPVDLVGVDVGVVLRGDVFAHNVVSTPNYLSIGGAMSFGPIMNANGGAAPLTMVNDTFAANRAGRGEQGIGGAINLQAGASQSTISAPQTFTNVTIAGNTATGDTGAGGALEVDNSGSFPPTLSLLNTIVANNHAATGPDCSGLSPPISLGHNLERHKDCGFTAPHDLNATNPLLGPLAANGGPTQTMALKPGSPARNAGANTDCPSTDQRGVHRPQGPRCDIGAYEAKKRHHHHHH